MILLVNTYGTKQGPYFDIPTNLLYLAAALRDAGIPCHLSDGNIVGFDGIKEDIERLKPDIVGISTLTPARFNAYKIAEYARSKGIMTVMGGHHSHWLWEQALQHVDVVAFGEGEKIIVDIATIPLQDIRGIAYEGHRTGCREYVNNLDEIAFPAWDMVNFDKYRRTKRAIGPRVFYSRGCLGKCKFCNSTRFWRGYRHRSPENFCNELEWLYDLGEKVFIFGDDNVDADGIMALFGTMVNRPNISRPNSVTLRVEGITEESCALMKACGVKEICLGVESGSQRMLDHMRKGITVEQSERAVKLVKKYGMKAVVLLLRNGISETPQDKQETIDFCERVKPDSIGSLNALWLHPGTAYYKEIQQGKYDEFIESGKELVDDSFFLNERYAQHVIAYRDGNIFPMRATDDI